MYRYAFIMLVVLFLCFSVEEAGAENIYRPNLKEVESAASPCLPGGSGKPIDERYTCPVGDFDSASSQGLTKERVECSVQIALSLEAIDKKAATWTKALQSSREKDVNKWIEDIRKETKKYEEQYAQVCSLTGWTMDPSTNGVGCAKTIGFFPETACKGIVNRKVDALQNVGYILASKGIAKSMQNDKDKNLDKIKSAYDLIGEKWSQYRRIVSIAVSKFTAYIKQAVKG